MCLILRLCRFCFSVKMARYVGDQGEYFACTQFFSSPLAQISLRNYYNAVVVFSSPGRTKRLMNATTLREFGQELYGRYMIFFRTLRIYFSPFRQNITFANLNRRRSVCSRFM